MNYVGDKIGWATHTCNPLTGCLNFPNCPYCYARRQAKRLAGRFGYPQDDPFRPTFHPERLEGPLRRKKPSRIFVCSMGELFGPWVPWSWIMKVIKITYQAPHHKFLFLTQFPERYKDFRFGLNCWLGTTITEFSQSSRVFLLPHSDRIFVSAEPLLTKVSLLYVPNLVKWIIIGPLSKGASVVQPAKEHIEDILVCADAYHIPVYMKPNLDWPNKRQEFPDDLRI